MQELDGLVPNRADIKILENGKTYKQSPGGKCRARIKVGMKIGTKKRGNRGIVLTEVPRSRLDLPLHSAALAPRLSFPLIVGNLLLASDNTNKCKSARIHKNPFSTNYSAIFFARSMCTNILSLCHIPDPVWVKDII